MRQGDLATDVRSRRDLTWPLFLLASFAVIGLLLTSDFSPALTTDISTLSPNTTRIQLVCTLTGTRTTEKGFMLVLEDSRGQQIEGFAATGLAPMPALGALIKVDAEVSWDDGPFLYLRAITLVE